VVLLLNPTVRRLARWGVPRRVGATVVFGLAVVLVAVLVSLAVPALLSQASHLQVSSPELIRKGGGAFERLSRSSSPLLRRVGSSISSWIQSHAGSAPQALHTLATAGLRFAHAGLILLIGGFLGFLLLVSLPETTRGIVAMIPPGRRERLGPTV